MGPTRNTRTTHHQRTSTQHPHTNRNTNTHSSRSSARQQSCAPQSSPHAGFHAGSVSAQPPHSRLKPDHAATTGGWSTAFAQQRTRPLSASTRFSSSRTLTVTKGRWRFGAGSPPPCSGRGSSSGRDGARSPPASAADDGGGGGAASRARPRPLRPRGGRSAAPLSPRAHVSRCRTEIDRSMVNGRIMFGGHAPPEASASRCRRQSWRCGSRKPAAPRVARGFVPFVIGTRGGRVASGRRQGAIHRLAPRSDRLAGPNSPRRRGETPLRAPRSR